MFFHTLNHFFPFEHYYYYHHSAVQNASKSLMEAITEVYESQWTGSEVLYGQAKTIDTQYQQFSYKLADQVLKQLDTYALQFPEMKVSKHPARQQHLTIAPRTLLYS